MDTPTPAPTSRRPPAESWQEADRTVPAQGLRKRGRWRRGAARGRGGGRRGLHPHEVLPGPQGSRGRSRAEPQAAWRRHVDLYIVHWPRGGPTWAWPGMERARELGHTRSIGVSNFDVGDLDALLTAAAIPPAVNQVQFSPFQCRRRMVEACQARNVMLESYSPLGTGRHLSKKTVKAVAERVGRTPAQVLLR